MPFLTRNENQSQVRYAAPARPMMPTTGAPATATSPAPATVTAAIVPLRLATTLLRWTSEEEDIKCRLHHGMPPVKPRGSRDTLAACAVTRPPQLSGDPGDRADSSLALAVHERNPTSRDKKVHDV